MIISPRFFGSDALELVLAGHRMFDGSGDPPEAIALVQQALADIGFTVDVNGTFDSETGDAVTAFKTSKGLMPNDPVVGPGTMAALDAEFAHELFDAKANEVAGTRFDLGSRIGTRVDIEDGFATCDFQNGICIEAGHVVAYAMPASVQAAWTAAGGLNGMFGSPTGDPLELDATQSVQEFTFVAHIFGGLQDVTLLRATWEASIAGGSMIGTPLGPPQAVGIGGASFVPHDRGVVLVTPELSPQPLPQAVFDLWSAREAAGTSLGPPTAFAFPSATGTTFPFLLGSVTLSDAGVASVSGPVGADLQRYFQPGDIDLHLTPRLAATNAKSFIGGAAAFASMRADIANTAGAGDFVYILSWHCNVDLQLIPGDPASTLRSLLADRASNGVQVRAILWAGDPVPAPPTIVKPFFKVSIPWQLTTDFARTKTSRTVNEPAVLFINGLLASGKDAAAILDDRHLFAGSHHQKAVIVGSGGKLIAYIGGIEINRDRLSPPLFPPPLAGQDAGLTPEPGSPLFDISVRLEDAGAFLVLETFINRWIRHPNQLGSPLRGLSAAIPLPAGGPLAVQVTHTYGRGFPFSIAVQTASTALSNGIKSARQFFYMEDQYFVGSPKMSAAIRDALSSNPGLVAIVVIAAEDSVSDTPDVGFRRRAFLQPIASSFPGQLLVFERLGGGSTTGPTAYVHTKLLIVDDEAAFIGSPNSNRRSWFHDSEIDATIVDTTGPGGTVPGTRGFVRDLRCELWARHLNVATGALGSLPIDVGLWRGVIGGTTLGASVRPYNVGAIVPRYAIAGVPVDIKLLELAWNTLEDPT
jgi:phosphatidylserine/phosphatidylglycerophosphate/cardiolipin synthase-like enzyme